MGGLKPLRKFRFSQVKEQGILTDIQARKQQGWTMESKTPGRYYHKDLDNNPLLFICIQYSYLVL